MGKPVKAGDVVGRAEAITVKPTPHGQSVLAACQECGEVYTTPGAWFRKGNRPCSCVVKKKTKKVSVGDTAKGMRVTAVHRGSVLTLCTRCGRTMKLYASRFGVKPCPCSKEKRVPDKVGVFKVGKPTGKRDRRGAVYNLTCTVCGAKHQKSLDRRLGTRSCASCKGKVLQLQGKRMTYKEAADALNLREAQLASAVHKHGTLQRAVRAIRSQKPRVVPMLGLTYNNRKLVKLDTGKGPRNHRRHKWRCLTCGGETELPVYQARKTGCFICRRRPPPRKEKK